MNSLKIISIFAAIGAFFSFSLLDLSVKILYQWYNPITLSMYVRIYASLIMVALLLLMSLKQRSWKPFVSKHPWSHIIRGFLLVFLSFCFSYGFGTLPLATSYSIVFLLPMFTAIFGAIMLKEHISKVSLYAIISGFIGIIIVLRPGIVPFSWGYISLLVAIIIEAPFFIMAKKYHKGESPIVIMVYTSIISAVLLIIIAFSAGVPLQIVESWHILLFLAGSICYVIAQSLLIFSLSRIPVHTSIAMQYTQIIWGTTFGFLFFQETNAFDIAFITGTAMIIISSYTTATGRFPFISKKN